MIIDAVEVKCYILTKPPEERSEENSNSKNF